VGVDPFVLHYLWEALLMGGRVKKDKVPHGGKKKRVKLTKKDLELFKWLKEHPEFVKEWHEYWQVLKEYS